MDCGLKNCFLFKGVSEEAVKELICDRGRRMRFKKGEEVAGDDDTRRTLGIVVSGEVEIYKTASDSQRIVLNTVKAGQPFGVASLFCGNNGVTTKLTASKNCEIIFLNRSDMEEIFRENFSIAINYLEFMSDRVCFLNKKIDSFTASTPEERLAIFLINSLEEAKETMTVDIPQGASRLAQSLNIGRASLYRAIDALENIGVIEKEEKRFLIKDKKQLLQIAEHGYKKYF